MLHGLAAVGTLEAGRKVPHNLGRKGDHIPPSDPRCGASSDWILNDRCRTIKIILEKIGKRFQPRGASRAR